MRRAGICLYCGRQGALSREHIIPEALGGTRRIQAVCEKCNNGVLSELDKELATASPMSIIAAEEMHKTTGYTWDVDHSENNLLLEAQADTSASSMTVWPQIIFDEKGSQFRADGEEIQHFGAENFQAVFMRHLLKAYHTVRTAKRPRIIFEPVPEKMSSQYRYPPRIFANRRIRDFDNRMHFRCRYLKAGDRREVRRQLDNWDQGTRFKSTDFVLGSSLPAFHFHYELTAIARGLIKTGINLLRFACKSTLVDREHFGEGIRVVTGERQLSDAALRDCGFVHATDLLPLDCSAGTHSIRLLSDGGVWRVWFAFFGGRIGAAASFPGPNEERWRTTDVTIPIGNGEWIIRESPLLQPVRARVERKDLQKIIPSIPMTNTSSVETVSYQQKNRSNHPSFRGSAS